MLIKLLRKRYTKNIKLDIFSTNDLNLHPTSQIDELNISEYQNKKITLKKINLQNEFTLKESSINLFNIDPSRLLHKINLYKNSQSSDLFKTQINNSNKNIVSLTDINDSIFTCSDIMFFLQNEFSDNEEFSLLKLVEILKGEIFTTRNSLVGNFETNIFLAKSLWDDMQEKNKEICLGGIPEGLFRYLICKNITKKSLIDGFKQSVEEIKKLFEEGKILLGRNFVEPKDIVKTHLNCKVSPININYIFELSKNLVKTKNKDIDIYLDSYNFQIMFDLLKLKNSLVEKDLKENNESLSQLRQMGFTEKNELFKRSYLNLFGEKSFIEFNKHKLEKNNLDYFFFDSPVEIFLKKSFQELNELDFLHEIISKENDDLIVKMASFDVFSGIKLFDEKFINNEFYYISNKNLSVEQSHNIKKKFFIAYKIFENIEKIAFDSIKSNLLLDEDIIEKEFEKLIFD